MTFDEMQRIISDVTNDRPLSIDGPEAERFAEAVKLDVAKAKRHGMVLSIPQELLTGATQAVE